MIQAPSPREREREREIRAWSRDRYVREYLFGNYGAGATRDTAIPTITHDEMSRVVLSRHAQSISAGIRYPYPRFAATVSFPFFPPFSLSFVCTNRFNTDILQEDDASGIKGQ